MSGFVYVDADQDGIFDNDEQPIFGVQVNLTGATLAGQSVSTQVTTDATGMYEFANLEPGVYRLQEIQPANFGQQGETIGTGSTLLAQNPVDNVFEQIGLGQDQDVINFNFGESRGILSKRNLLTSNQ